MSASFQLIAVVTALAALGTSHGQGTITFNGAASFSGIDYYESGVWFHTVSVTPGTYERLAVSGLGGSRS